MAARVPDPGEIVGPYRLIRRLGEGGMGCVFAAERLRDGERVALKVLKPEGAADALDVARFEREARLASSLRSDHTVKVLDSGRSESGVPYIAMELVDAPDLAREVGKGAVIDHAIAVGWVIGILEALGEAHRLGIVHRDVKPSNVLIDRSGGGAVAKLADFGISKEIVGAALTATGTFVGTPRFMAPEQITDPKHLDGRADLWSVGVMLYELLSGRSPFGSGPAVAIMESILLTEPLPIGGIPEGLSAAVMTALEKDREQRHPTAEAFAAALAPFAVRIDGPATLDLREIKAPSGRSGEPTRSRTRRRPRPRRAWVFALAAVAGGGLATFALALLFVELAGQEVRVRAAPASVAEGGIVAIETAPLSQAKANGEPPPKPSARVHVTHVVAGTSNMSRAEAIAFVASIDGQLQSCERQGGCPYPLDYTLSGETRAVFGATTCAVRANFSVCVEALIFSGARRFDLLCETPRCNLRIRADAE